METKNIIKQIRNAITRADSIMRRKDGTWIIKDGFFYTHGRTAKNTASRIKEQLVEMGIQIEVLKAEECWKKWPKDSYFRTEFKVIN